jgi:hypothetical protein
MVIRCDARAFLWGWSNRSWIVESLMSHPVMAPLSRIRRTHGNSDYAGWRAVRGGRASRGGLRRQRTGRATASSQRIVGPGGRTVGWLDSPGHCENIMDPRFTEMGIAYATGQVSKRGLYWVQLLAAPLATKNGKTIPLSRPDAV